MKILKRIAALLTAAGLMLFTALSAFAAESIDTNRNITLTISYTNNGTPIADAEFSIYLVAEADTRGNLVTTENFSGYNVDITDDDNGEWGILATTLEGYVLRDQILPTDSQKTNQQGLASFPNEGIKLTPGLYLVLGTRHTQNEVVYETLPFMMFMPMQEQGEEKLNYDVAVRPKFDSRSIYDDSAITCKVVKVWNDKGNEAIRPKEAIVQLLRDGQIFDTVALNAENNWRYMWTDLDVNHQWRVVEKELEDYTVLVSREDIAFVITNTCVREVPTEPGTENNKPTNPDTTPDTTGSTEKTVNPDDSTLPQTGQLWWPVPILSAAGLLFIIIGLLFLRGKSNEEN